MSKLRVALPILALRVATNWCITPTFAQEPCRFVMGFAALRDLVGAQKVGNCLEDEHFNDENGNAEQRTSGGLLVWRKVDNFTAFTDGGTTWVNGPNGLQSRPNSQRFTWEKDPPSAPARTSSAPISAPPPSVAAAPPSPPSTQVLAVSADIARAIVAEAALPDGFGIHETLTDKETSDQARVTRSFKRQSDGSYIYVGLDIWRTEAQARESFQFEKTQLEKGGETFKSSPIPGIDGVSEIFSGVKRGSSSRTTTIFWRRANAFSIVSWIDEPELDRLSDVATVSRSALELLNQKRGAIAPPSQASAPSPPPTAPPAPSSTPDSTGGREALTNVAGQQAIGFFGDQSFRATVREMTVTKILPAAQSRDWGNHNDRAARGKFVVVLADVEDVCNGPACCLPGFRLRDSRGRFFSGDTNQADVLVKHGVAAIYPSVTYKSGDYQPNLPMPRVFVYDIPADANGLALVSDGR